ncbi:hypothetical protein GCM10023238_15790 [Streptomyces heliomycini]
MVQVSGRFHRDVLKVDGGIVTANTTLCMQIQADVRRPVSDVPCVADDHRAARRYRRGLAPSASGARHRRAEALPLQRVETL